MTGRLAFVYVSVKSDVYEHRHLEDFLLTSRYNSGSEKTEISIRFINLIDFTINVERRGHVSNTPQVYRHISTPDVHLQFYMHVCAVAFCGRLTSYRVTFTHRSSSHFRIILASHWSISRCTCHWSCSASTRVCACSR